MSKLVRQSSSRQAGLRSLSEGLLRKCCGIGVSRNTLEIHHPDVAEIGSAYPYQGASQFGVSLSFVHGRPARPGKPVYFDTAQLPFQDKTFSMVVLHHVIRDGKEAELSEAVRVLERGGLLILLGLNRVGWRYQFNIDKKGLPGMAPLNVKVELDRMNMTLQEFAGAGLLGMNRPSFMGSGPAGLGLPVADIVVLTARRKNEPEMTSLRFRERRSGIVQSAPLRG